MTTRGKTLHGINICNRGMRIKKNGQIVAKTSLAVFKVQNATERLQRFFDFADDAVQRAHGEIGLLFVDHERRAKPQSGVA
jgi:hypothetical protein